MKILATIAARGGSKGIPNKNIRNLAGKPLIAYTIEQIKKWGKYEKFIVSTDSTVIADIARSYRVDVPFMRPAELAGDNIGKVEVLRHTLIKSENYYGIEFDAVLDADVTAPIRTIEDLDNIIELFKTKKADTIFSVVEAYKNPYFNMVEISEDGTAKLCKTFSSLLLTRQSAPKVYIMNSSLYVYRRDFLFKSDNKSALSGRSFVYEMDEISSVDIDREIDFKFIEFLIKEGVVNI